jgi:hypothetical protein
MSAHVTPERVDFAAVKAASLRSLDFIIPRLLPGGKREGDEWVVLNPTRNDNKPGSFSVNMRTGVWSDFAYAADKGGDMIDLVMYLNRKSNLDAARELAHMLGMTGAGSSQGPSKPAFDTTDKTARLELQTLRTPASRRRHFRSALSQTRKASPRSLSLEMTARSRTVRRSADTSIARVALLFGSRS